MTRRWIARLAALAAACAMVAAPARAETQPNTTKPDSTATLTDESFVKQALDSGEKEVVLAKLAADKASSGDVKQLAEMLLEDHQKVNEQLRLIAARNGAPKTETTPSSPGQRSDTPPPGVAPGAGPSQSPDAQRLAKLLGKEFDKAFLDLIIAGHEKSVSLYERASTTLKDGAAKKLATDTLPKIKEHLKQAKSLGAEGGKPQGTKP